MGYCRNILLPVCMLIIITGCRNPKSENLFYKPYFERATPNSKQLMSGVLDTIALLFEKEPPGLKDRATYYRLKSEYYRNKGNFTASLTMLDSLRIFLNDHSTTPLYQELYPMTMLSIADDYTQLELYDKTMEPLLTATQHIGKNPSAKSSESKYYAQLGRILMLQGRHKMAIPHFLHSKSAQYCESGTFDCFYNSYSSLHNISTCYIRMEMYDSAQYYADAAMDYVISNQFKFPDKASYMVLCKAIIKGNAASIKAGFKQYSEAENLLLTAIEETAETYPFYAMLRKLDLLRVYLLANKLEPAKKLLQFFDTTINNKKISFTPFHKNQVTISHKIYYQKKGDLSKAFHFAEKALLYYDSLDIARRSRTEKDPGLELENKTQLIANELLKARYEQRSFQLLASVLLIVLVLIVATFIAFHSKRTQKHARMQEYLNQEIQLKNDEIKDAYTSLEGSYQANTELMLTVAHDLKNPIVGITNLTKLLLKDNPPNVKQNLELIVAASVNATELINNLMNRNDNRADTGEKKLTNIMRLVEYCVELMKPKAKQKNQELCLRGTSASILINKNEMWRVIINIINNAIKFSPEHTTIEICLQKQESEVLLSFKDQGIGIPKNILKGLFTLGKEIQRTGTAGEPSYGLGLKISKKIVEQHSGLLWAESEEGQGSTFFITLPVVENQPAGLSQKNTVIPSY